MSKSASNSPFPGQSIGVKQVEPLGQSGKGNENKSLDQSGKSDKSDREKTCTKMKRRKIRARSPSPKPKKKAKKAKSIEREDAAIVYQKTLRPVVVTHMWYV